MSKKREAEREELSQKKDARAPDADKSPSGSLESVQLQAEAAYRGTQSSKNSGVAQQVFSAIAISA